ncbi:MAG: carbonate dehydratase [Bryobacterales bacterium]|nr:carbonate dehydratase [Bryobacterales bacterium]
MKVLTQLAENNRSWARRISQINPKFFPTLAAQQAPEYLWIGCSDSRVPANEIVGLLPGELFVHRNIANLVVHTDLNCLSVVQYSIEVLKVKHVIVCGHYRCGGVKAAMGNTQFGLIDNWLRNIKDLYAQHRAEVDSIHDPDARLDRLCELNVARQVSNLCHTSIVQSAWRNGQDLMIHGWIYGLHDGLIHDLGFYVSSVDQIPDLYRVVPAPAPQPVNAKVKKGAGAAART